MGYRDIPHAAANELMAWVRQRGKQVVRLHTWAHPASWSSLPDWSAHIELRGARPLHARITRRGYKFTVIPESADVTCPACCAHAASSIVASPATSQSHEPVLVTPP